MTRHHPTEHDLALLAGGELSVFRAWRIRRHVLCCEQCLTVVEDFRLNREILRLGHPLPEVDWERLSAEMEANIHLGLEAGECVGPASPRPLVPVGWRMLATYAALLVAVVGVVWWQRPGPAVPAAAQPGAVFRISGDLIQLQQDGRSMGLLHEGAANVTYTAAANGAVEARYVDADTGQVTIQNVVFSE